MQRLPKWLHACVQGTRRPCDRAAVTREVDYPESLWQMQIFRAWWAPVRTLALLQVRTPYILSRGVISNLMGSFWWLYNE